MQHNETFTLRLPADLRAEIEKERVRRSRMAGVEIKAAAVVRAALEQTFKPRRAPRAGASAR